MMQRLEEEFQQTLLIRDNRQVSLSKEGERFVIFAKEVVALWSNLKHDFQYQGQDVQGELKVYCTVTAAHLYLSEILPLFRQRYPNIELTIDTGDVSLAHSHVADGLADVSFAVAGTHSPRKYLFTPVDTIPLKIIAPHDGGDFAAELQREDIQWSQIPFVMPEAGPAKEHVKQWLKRMNIKPKVYAYVSGHEAIVSMTALGCGISVVPQPVLEHSPLKHKIRVLPCRVVPQPFQLGVICLSRRKDEPVIRVFNELMMELF